MRQRISIVTTKNKENVLKIGHGFSLFSPDNTQWIKPKFSQVYENSH